MWLTDGKDEDDDELEDVSEFELLDVPVGVEIDDVVCEDSAERDSNVVAVADDVEGAVPEREGGLVDTPVMEALGVLVGLKLIISVEEKELDDVMGVLGVPVAVKLIVHVGEEERDDVSLVDPVAGGNAEGGASCARHTSAPTSASMATSVMAPEKTTAPLPSNSCTRSPKSRSV